MAGKRSCDQFQTLEAPDCHVSYLRFCFYVRGIDFEQISAGQARTKGHSYQRSILRGGEFFRSPSHFLGGIQAVAGTYDYHCSGTPDADSDVVVDRAEVH